MFSYLGTPSSRGLDQRLYGLSGVGNVPGGLWVVLELEWSSRAPPAEFYRDHLTSPQPHPLILLFFLLLRRLLSAHLRLSLFLGSGDGCLSLFSFVFRMFMKADSLCCIMIA